MSKRCAVCGDLFTLGGEGVLGEFLCHDDEWSCYTAFTQSSVYPRITEMTRAIKRVKEIHFKGRVRKGR